MGSSHNQTRDLSPAAVSPLLKCLATGGAAYKLIISSVPLILQEFFLGRPPLLTWDLRCHAVPAVDGSGWQCHIGILYGNGSGMAMDGNEWLLMAV